MTDAKGQLTAVRDAAGQTLESYVWDPVGNLLEKTVRGRSTKYEYDAANQLTAQITDAGTPQEKRVEFAYDGAGRMTREGQREYRYGGLDKVVAVLEAGRTVAEFAYGADGQLANITRRNGENERLWWRGLALTRRDYLNGKEVVSSERYLNEPHATGGNPVLVWEGSAAPASAKEQAHAAATRLLFNDMLGSTLAVLDGDKAQDTGMTLFGETPDGQAQGFFTGKPHIDELGYAFLFRNYRPEKAKWQTADPLGYPDGWNALAYCNNGVWGVVDQFGLAGWKIDLALWPKNSRDGFDYSQSIRLDSDEHLDYSLGFVINRPDSPSSSLAIQWYFYCHYFDQDYTSSTCHELDFNQMNGKPTNFGEVKISIDHTGHISCSGNVSAELQGFFDGGWGWVEASGFAGGSMNVVVADNQPYIDSNVEMNLGFCIAYTLNSSAGLGIGVTILDNGGSISYTGKTGTGTIIGGSKVERYVLRRWYEE